VRLDEPCDALATLLRSQGARRDAVSVRNLRVGPRYEQGADHGLVVATDREMEGQAAPSGGCVGVRAGGEQTQHQSRLPGLDRIEQRRVALQTALVHVRTAAHQGVDDLDRAPRGGVMERRLAVATDVVDVGAGLDQDLDHANVAFDHGQLERAPPLVVRALRARPPGKLGLHPRSVPADRVVRDGRACAAGHGHQDDEPRGGALQQAERGSHGSEPRWGPF
jgi:hypothetical protein